MSENKNNSNNDSLTNLRSNISQLDLQILEVLSNRRKLINQIVAEKDKLGLPIRDVKREEELLSELIKSGKKSGLDPFYISTIFHHVIEDALRLQNDFIYKKSGMPHESNTIIKVGYFGVDGSSSHRAAAHFFNSFSDKIELFSYSALSQIQNSLDDGKIHYAALPIENTTSGSINEVYDFLSESNLHIIGEHKLKVDHVLLASSEISLGSIKTIYCTPVVRSECNKFLESLPGIKIQYVSDAAIAMEQLLKNLSAKEGVIGDPEKGREMGMYKVADNVANEPESFDRYIIVGTKPKKVDSRISAKVSLVTATGHKPGALVEALIIFRDHCINLTKIESRPMPGKPWEEMFYLDFEGNLEDANVQNVIRELTAITRFIKVLGCYPRFDLEPTNVPSESYLTPPPASCSGETKQAEPVKAKPQSKKGYKLASRYHKENDTVIEVKGVKIGGNNFIVMAGPCSVESYDQIMICAKEAKEHGTDVLRGGVFKPRTNPYSFQGLGYEGLNLLVEAGKRYGMPIITEVMSSEDVERVAEYADIIQIGARNMQNFSLLKLVGRIKRPVMVKRGMSSSLDELLQAVEYILAEGNQEVILCERGIRTFETATRNTLDISAVPVLKRDTHLPIIIDPSHASGDRELVAPLAKAAKAVGAHGIMVEFHPEPEKALSDGPQSLYFPQFEGLMADLRRITV